MKHVYTIKKSDVGKTQIEIVFCRHCGSKKTMSITDVMGKILDVDVNKKLYMHNDRLYVENVAK